MQQLPTKPGEQGSTIDGYNGKLELVKAYAWVTQDICNFLMAIAGDALAYKENQAYVPPATDLAAIWADIQELMCPPVIKKTIYSVEKLKPKTHMDRALDPHTTPWENVLAADKPNVSKFLIPANVYTGENIVFPSLYDRLGLFMSCVDTAPKGANIMNFYLPMLLVYGQWCNQIGNMTPKRNATAIGTCSPPTVYQITWRKTGQQDETPQFFLGSSLTPFEKLVSAVGGQWEWVVKQKRYDILTGMLTDGNQKTWAFNDSPNIVDKGKSGTRFGNCGETYPLKILLKNQANNQKCYGIAIKETFLATANMVDAMKALEGLFPCDNCKALITWNGGDLTEFPEVAVPP